MGIEAAQLAPPEAVEVVAAVHDKPADIGSMRTAPEAFDGPALAHRQGAGRGTACNCGCGTDGFTNAVVGQLLSVKVAGNCNIDLNRDICHTLRHQKKARSPF